ncbi:PstS family phosphate ABC transporter substrate-binding protein [Pelagibacterium xiamenense]|uniref:PstS family phosphate ABC transporter substrate-binding protein n=1 Tax=Pelagibacterium xiamenense TaxID=2901140 RepID=UPI001E3E3BAE|nr:substrate-binding domain-containing protein [Pelagibacterium xiamenense]MCD7058984.1 substrate-binding domain-containing protein [Pelagibacterium xiamenense]
MKTALMTSAAALVVATLGATAAQAQSRDTIQIAGSSTVLPFASIVAEEFGAAYPEFNTPVVGSGGSSGGLRQFCEGVGENTIDIANASRKIREGEIEACHAAGVEDIREIVIGYDGIVFAVGADKADFALEPIQVYKALAAQVPMDGEMVDNPYTNWSEIDASLPDQAIALAIPASNHGTREVFEENVVLPGCEAAELPEMGEDEMEAACLSFRQDVVVEIAGDYTETLARLEANPDTMGVFGLSFYDQNRDTLKVATVSGVEPTMDTIAAGEYPVSRPLQFYVKGQHVGVIPGIEEYVAFFLSDAIAGAGGRLEEAGLIPASADFRAQEVANFNEGIQAGEE